MKDFVTVIGSGNAFHYDGRAHACYLIEAANGPVILMDCGATSLLRLREKNFDLSRIDGCLITHFHGDHLAGLPFLLLDQKYIQNRTRPFVVAGPPGIRQATETLFDLLYPGVQLNHPVNYKELSAGQLKQPFTGIEVMPYKIIHKEESLAYRLRFESGRTLFFSGDTACDEYLHFALTDGDPVNLAIIELSLPGKSDTAHVSLEEVKESRRDWKAERMIYSHIYDDLARQAEAWISTTAQDDATAFDWMRLEI